jgi:Heparinase II/III-like protein/Heparinase II/III N-terminus
MSDAALLARTTGQWSSMDALLEGLAARPPSSFVLPHDSADETDATLKHHYPEYLTALIAGADACCRNELSLLGRNFRFAGGIDWLQDPVTGWCWPLLHRGRVAQYVSSDVAVDPLFLWELNRHQHFITLGMAFWVTKDERYVDAFNSQVQSWIEANPLQHGINWLDGLEISVRLIAWTVAFQFFRSSVSFRRQAGSAFLKSLWQQADFLSRHLQTTTNPAAVPNNHIIGELTGLVVVGSAFPEFSGAAEWQETSLRMLSQQVTAQTHSDGINKEQATGYHRFVIEFLLLIVARNRQDGLQPVPILRDALERMLDYVLGTMTPSGTVPMWGDSPSGRALSFGVNKAFWDLRPFLAAGAALFVRSDWKYAAKTFPEEALWLLGTAGWDRWQELDEHPPAQISHGYSDAGLYIIRDAWTADTDLAVFRCGPFGLGGEGHSAHAHCDLLSPVLWVRGQPVLVDSGTYSYAAPWRDRFRVTAAHNALMVDGHEQANPLGKFSWKHVPEAECTGWDGQWVRGVFPHYGQVEFSRELLHPRPGAWALVDTLNGPAEHLLEWFFHFAPGLELDLHDVGHTVTVLKDGRSYLTLEIPDGGVCLQLREGWYSEQYGVKECNQVLYAQWKGELGHGVSFRWRFQLVR